MAGFATCFAAVAVFFVLAGVVEGQDYFTGPYGTNLCPGGSEQVLSESACEEASGDLGYSLGIPESCSDCPKGCYTTEPPNAFPYVWLNTHPTGGISELEYVRRAPICRTCPAGSYSDTPGGPCQSCPTVQGNYCALGSTADDTSCAAGYFCPDIATQTACPAGTFSDSVGATSQTTCEVCEAGNFCPDTATQTGCPAGSFCPEGSTSPTACPAGSFCPEGSTSPTACPAGTFSDSTSQTTCQVCEAVFSHYETVCPTPEDSSYTAANAGGVVVNFAVGAGLVGLGMYVQKRRGSQQVQASSSGIDMPKV